MNHEELGDIKENVTYFGGSKPIMKIAGMEVEEESESESDS